MTVSANLFMQRGPTRPGSRPHERLAVLVVARAVALDRVARQRERRAREADERHLVLELAAQDLDRLHHVAGVLDRVGDAAASSTSATVRTGLWMIGPSPFANSRSRPMPGNDDEDVGEQDGRVDADEVDRLHRDLDGELGRAAHLEEAVLLADGAVLGHVAAGLAHHPHRRALGRLAAGGTQEEVVVGHGERSFRCGLRRARSAESHIYHASARGAPTRTPVRGRAPRGLPSDGRR